MTDTTELKRFTENKTPFMEEHGLFAWIYANDSTNPVLAGLIDMFYNGVFENTLGIMVAKNTETGAEETILVGIVPTSTPDGEYAATIPLARLLSKEESAIYMAPDGKGGYIDHRITE